MKALRNIIVGVIVLVVIAAAIGFFLPGSVSVERSITINAPKESVFRVVSSLRAFSLWSPWTSQDPAMVFTFEGPESGVGEKMHWSSKKGRLGSGTMEIKDTAENERVGLAIAFGGTGTASSNLSLAAADESTKVTWAFNYGFGGNPFARYMGLVMPHMIGDEYDHGLLNLKKYVEGIPRVDFSKLAISRVTVAPQTLIAYRVTCDNTPAAMAAALADGFTAAHRGADELGVTVSGAPISVARGFQDGKIALDAALPITQAPAASKEIPEGITILQIEEGQALRVVHKGNYGTLNDTYVQMLAYAATNGWRLYGASWNQYVSDPGKVAEADLETDIYASIEKRLVRRAAGGADGEP